MKVYVIGKSLPVFFCDSAGKIKSDRKPDNISPREFEVALSEFGQALAFGNEKQAGLYADNCSEYEEANNGTLLYKRPPVFLVQVPTTAVRYGNLDILERGMKVSYPAINLNLAEINRRISATLNLSRPGEDAALKRQLRFDCETKQKSIISAFQRQVEATLFCAIRPEMRAHLIPAPSRLVPSPT